ncbi:MAG: flagellar hook-basal body complex protein FliE [Thalassovita sp.]
MTISSLSGQSTLAALASRSAAPAQPQVPKVDQDAPSFADRIGDALEQVNDAQAHAKGSATAYETGQTDNLASVMVDQQVASLGFQMTLNVRNKALSAYRDIMNMPV